VVRHPLACLTLTLTTTQLQLCLVICSCSLAVHMLDIHTCARNRCTSCSGGQKHTWEMKHSHITQYACINDVDELDIPSVSRPCMCYSG
jgi:hypothetical protein